MKSPDLPLRSSHPCKRHMMCWLWVMMIHWRSTGRRLPLLPWCCWYLGPRWHQTRKVAEWQGDPCRTATHDGEHQPAFSGWILRSTFGTDSFQCARKWSCSNFTFWRQPLDYNIHWITISTVGAPHPHVRIYDSLRGVLPDALYKEEYCFTSDHRKEILHFGVCECPG